jgi:hypothetical protein
MERGTNKFLITVFASLMAFSVVAAPFLSVEKVNAQDGGSWTTLVGVIIRNKIRKNGVE